MRLIVITKEAPYEDEAADIEKLLRADSGVIVHLRHPKSSRNEYEKVLDRLPHDLLGRITIGDYFDLADEYQVGGVHLGSRNPQYTGNRKLRISKSCHSLEELKDKEEYEYVFLSPIFDSISKQGYNSAFDKQILLKAKKEKMIGQKVVALGGICASNIKEIKSMGFGGAALLGAAWNGDEADNIKKLRQLMEQG